jgi:hypothetical protein
MKSTRFNRSKARYSYQKAHIGKVEDDEVIAFNTVAENLTSMHWNSGVLDQMVNDIQYFKDKKLMENPIKIAIATETQDNASKVNQTRCFRSFGLVVLQIGINNMKCQHLHLTQKVL